MLRLASLSPSRHRRPAAEGPHLHHILRSVSRSFYLSLIVLPASVRRPVSLAYLFCRTADTIADAWGLPLSNRLQALESFRRQFMTSLPTYEALSQLQQVPLPHQLTAGERQLLRYLPTCFRVLTDLPPGDQHLMRELVLTLIRGMEMDLQSFPGTTLPTARPLPDIHALDLYTYYVAGVVGEFWTKIHLRHLPALRHADCQRLCTLAVRFGKGLQLTNILKDLGKDLHHGRCYLPQKYLEQLRIRVGELDSATALQRIRPLVHALVWYTLDHLDHARDYILHLPHRTVRLRLSCMWPLLFAVQTLTLVCQSEQLLHPRASIKISRHTVYRTMFWSLWCLAWPELFTGYYSRLRCSLTSTLDRNTAEPSFLL